MKKEKYVHAMASYMCCRCKKLYKLYIETGIEDSCDAKHIPISFTCKKCGGCATWINDIRRLETQIRLTDEMNYISNRRNNITGVPTIRRMK